MLKRLLLVGVICFVGISASFSQEQSDTKTKILQKEIALENATNSSRQILEENTLELIDLYKLYKSELEVEIKMITDSDLLMSKKQELEELEKKIENYSPLK